MSRRDGLTGQTESYDYDGQNRLVQWQVGRDGSQATIVRQVSYNDAGLMTGISAFGIGDMRYEDAMHSHALTGIGGVPEVFNRADMELTYTPFGKVSSITEGAKSYSILYGVDRQRIKSTFSDSGAVTTRYYLGDYEEVVDSLGNVTKYHYLCGGAVLRERDGNRELFLTHCDRLGSVTTVTTAQGEIIERYAYSPWGMRVDPDDWSALDERTSFWNNRGYTGHEHLDGFDLINMNGRMYDPLTCMFLSPDPQLQDPYRWLNYNRYAYCYGNPNMYTDPSGEFAWIPLLAGAVFGFVSSMASTMNSNLSVGARIGYSFLGAAIGAGGAYLGGLAAGSAMAVGALPGALVGGVTSAAVNAAGTFVSYGVLNVMQGDNFFGNNFGAAVGFSALSGFVSGCISGGMSGYNRAKELGADNLWTGRKWRNVLEYNAPIVKNPRVSEGAYCYAKACAYADDGHGNASVSDFIRMSETMDGGDDVARVWNKLYPDGPLAEERLFNGNWDYLGSRIQNGSEIIGFSNKEGNGHWFNVISVTVGERLKVFGGGWTGRVLKDCAIMCPNNGFTLFTGSLHSYVKIW